MCLEEDLFAHCFEYSHSYILRNQKNIYCTNSINGYSILKELNVLLVQ